MAVKTARPRRSPKPKAIEARVLVVEAKAGDWQHHQNGLAVAGFDLETVTFGVRASKRLEEDGFDLVLIDGSVSANKARNLLAKIRKTRAISDLPVIVVTSDAGSAETVRALESGASDCVAMPIDRPVLAARIRAQLTAMEINRPQKEKDSAHHGKLDWLQLIMDNATTAIFETSANGTVTRMNMTASFLAGRDSKDVIGKRLGSLFVDDAEREISELIARVATDGYFVSNHPARLRDEYGEERVLSLSLRRIAEAADANSVVATAEDITDTWQRRSASLPVESRVPANRPAPRPAVPANPDTIVGRALLKGAQARSVAALEENRLDARRRVFKGAKLAFNDDASLMDCLVRDISDSGAKLVFESFFDCPRIARLRISDGQVYDCEICWFANKIMGVRFLSRLHESG